MDHQNSAKAHVQKSVRSASAVALAAKSQVPTDVAYANVAIRAPVAPNIERPSLNTTRIVSNVARADGSRAEMAVTGSPSTLFVGITADAAAISHGVRGGLIRNGVSMQ